MAYQNILSSSCTYETIADSGEVLTKTSVKKADLVLGRNDYGALVLFVNGGRFKEVFLLNSFTVHKKFLNEGKASLTFPLKKRRIMIFNSPSEKQQALMSLKASFSEVSPLTAKDLNVLNNRGQKDGGKIKRKAENTPNNKETLTPLKESNIKKESIKPKAKRQLQLINQSTTHKHQPSTEHQPLDTLKNNQNPAISHHPSTSAAILSSEQTSILEGVNAGKNIFITGSAGTGKSFILNKIIRSSPPDTTFTTASTGLAACHLRGTTIHSFAGIGSGREGVEECVRLASRAPIKAQWKVCRLLIIDEISMISGDYFDKLETTARLIRKSSKAFGGIQLVLCGDFLQLPPIMERGEDKMYAFQSSAWERCRLQCYQLRQVHRQSDPSFVNLLNKIRLGICTVDMEQALKATRNHHSSPRHKSHNDHSHNDHSHNDHSHNDHSHNDHSHNDHSHKNHSHNNQSHNNHSHNNHSHHDIVATKLCTHKGDVDIINTQQLAKLTSTPRTFPSIDHPPSATTILNSLIPTPSSLTLKVGAQVMITKNVSVAGGLVNGARGVVVALQSKDNGGPVVRLLSGREHVMRVEKWVVGGVGGVQMQRKQLPLKLAWALSIHKSQGMTLDHVEVSLSRVFEAGQAYVALSRASSLKGLRVVHFDRKCIRADEVVLQFYRGLGNS